MWQFFSSSDVIKKYFNWNFFFSSSPLLLRLSKKKNFFVELNALYRKLFVGGLSWETTQDTLQRYFSHYGEVIDCVVMKNNETGRSRGFGFV